jgi:hypothetical protein
MFRKRNRNAGGTGFIRARKYTNDLRPLYPCFTRQKKGFDFKASMQYQSLRKEKRLDNQGVFLFLKADFYWLCREYTYRVFKTVKIYLLIYLRG